MGGGSSKYEQPVSKTEIYRRQLQNFARLSTAIGACCPDRGERPRDFWLELKELFR